MKKTSFVSLMLIMLAVFSLAGSPIEPVFAQSYEEPLANIQVSPITSPMTHLANATEDENRVYSAVVSGFYAMQEEIDLPEFDGSVEEVKNVAMAALHAPEVFWVNPKSAKLRTNSDGSYTVCVEYTMTMEEKNTTSEQIESLVQQVLAGANTPEDAAGKIEKWLVENVHYDYDEATQTLPCRAQSTSAFVDRLAVCSGYGKAFVYAMNRAGFQASYCVGYVRDVCHAWNYYTNSNGQEILVDILNNGIRVSEAEYSATSIHAFQVN